MCYCELLSLCLSAWVCAVLMRRGELGGGSSCDVKTWENQVSDFGNAPPGLLRLEVKGHRGSFVMCCRLIPPTVDLPAEPEQMNVLEVQRSNCMWTERPWLFLSGDISSCGQLFYLPDGLQITFFYSPCLLGFKTTLSTWRNVSKPWFFFFFFFSKNQFLLTACQLSWRHLFFSCASSKLIKSNSLSNYNPPAPKSSVVSQLQYSWKW